MGSRPGTTNNPDHEKNLTPFSDPEKARAAARKSAEVRRANKLARAQVEAVIKRDVSQWIELYKREELPAMCAAAAQKIAHMILDGEITDQRALVSAMPVLLDMARIEEGLHTTATMHASVSLTPDAAMNRIDQLRAQALGQPHAAPSLVSGHTSTEHPPAHD